MKYKVWWMCGEKTHNFGDVLTPLIFKHFSIDFEYSKENYNTICVGSISNKATNNCLVLGSGIAWENVKLNPNADWRFVRGPLTRDSVIKSGGNCPEIYGDPALLLPLIYSESKKKYDIGIIPHYKEYEMVKNKFSNHFVINLNNPNPKEVVNQITQCRSIVSSSLHGIIGAHAYGIPAAWVKFSDIIIGDNIKYKDYFLSIGLNAELSSLDKPIFKVGSIDTNKIQEIFKSLK
jgi:hypothetical protein